MNRALIGNSAVGLVMVEGPGSMAFSLGERLTVAVEVSQGFDMIYRLSAASPVNPHLLFLTETRFVTLTLDPATVPAPTGAGAAAEYEPCEAPWRDAALAALGYSAGTAGINSYVQYLMSKAWAVGVTPTSGYVVFVTKYNAAWMAYCRSSLKYLVLQYPWLATTVPDKFGGTNVSGWGSTNIDRVFAHETGHIFGAPDEYRASSCSNTAPFGALGVVNGNCEVGTASPVACLMAHNTENLCSFTPGHWGWVDANRDGVLDVSP
ncbi:MAG: hypothetical protein M3256_19320 [Actinomycetota bacterium]|nr:hypothetical protein [Actinomycetota bacterium]